MERSWIFLIALGIEQPRGTPERRPVSLKYSRVGTPEESYLHCQTPGGFLHRLQCPQSSSGLRLLYCLQWK